MLSCQTDAQKNLQKVCFTFFVILTPSGPENYYYHGLFDKNRRKKINNVEVYKKAEKTLSPNLSTTPIKAMGCQQCLPLSVHAKSFNLLNVTYFKL